MNLNSFLREHCSNVDLFGQCFSKCRDFLQHLYRNCNDVYKVECIDANNLLIKHRNNTYTIKIVDAVCFFDNMYDFQQHALIISEKFNHQESKVSIQCYKVDGIKFHHLIDNIYIKDTLQQHYTATGFLHWVVLVDKINEQYVVDPTIKQFHTAPSQLLLNISSQNGLTPTIPSTNNV